MKEIIRITIGLTISCLIAAIVMGSVFAVTDKAKKHNEHQGVQDTMLSLLGYNDANPKPAEMSIYTFYRYNMAQGEDKYLGYLVPVVDNEKVSHELLTIDLAGNFVDRVRVDLSAEAAAEAPNRKIALKKVVKSSRTFDYADSTIIATLENKRVAYVLPGEFPGFKTFIKVMLALETDFDILGLEIMEHEEDPGLGGEIEQEYFKNQFTGKPFETIRKIGVVKKPLPEEYRKVLESAKWKKSNVSEKDVKETREKYRDQEIYALTGATISSRAVTDGVKNIVKKFAYRLKKLDDVIEGQNISVAF